MLMLPNPIATIHSKYSAPFEPGVRFALELSDSFTDMSTGDDLQLPNSQSQEESPGLSEHPSSLGISRYVYPTHLLAPPVER